MAVIIYYFVLFHHRKKQKTIGLNAVRAPAMPSLAFLNDQTGALSSVPIDRIEESVENARSSLSDCHEVDSNFVARVQCGRALLTLPKSIGTLNAIMLVSLRVESHVGIQFHICRLFSVSALESAPEM